MSAYESTANFARMEIQDGSFTLHERRRRKDQDQVVNFSQVKPIRTSVGKRSSALKVQLSPAPETPLSSGNAKSQPDQQSVFQNYLRAFCQYDPPTYVDGKDEALLTTVPIRPGDLILIHSVHSNGWADGTVLTTRVRGWLPTNYCESFDHPYMRNLLNALTQFWDLLGTGEGANLSTFVRQDYIRGLIAGVRYILEHADCLHRDAALVLRSTGIRRMRKGLLSDLSALVTLAKRLQETITEPYAGEVIHDILDDLMAKAFKVVTRAVGFVDMLARESDDGKPLRVRKPSVPHSLSSSVEDEGNDLNAFLHQESLDPKDSGKQFLEDSAGSYASLEAATGLNFVRGSEDGRGLRSPAVFRPPSGVTTHRLSLIKREYSRSGTLASEQLSNAHDNCISHIGAFLGLYLHSRPSSELVATTERLVNACKTMISIVGQVSSRDPHKRTSVQEAQMNFQLTLDELTRSTKDAFKFFDGPDDDIVMLPEQTNHLVNVGTSLIRSVGECVVKTRKVIEHTGDFDLQESVDFHHRDPDEDAWPGATSIEDEYQHSEASEVTTTESDVSRDLPSLGEVAMATTDVTDFAQPYPASNSEMATQMTTHPLTSRTSFPLPLNSSTTRLSPTAVSDSDALRSPRPPRSDSISPDLNYSIAGSVSGSTDTHPRSMRDSGITAISEVSTRATTPDQAKDSHSPNPGYMSSLSSVSSLRSDSVTDASNDAEDHLLQKTYANELTLNKDGQVTGGSLPALVEQLTPGDAAPDSQFVAAFFLTFRSFTTSRELAQTLIHRFEYVGDSSAIGTPVRLRIYNVFKGWLETYWNADADKDALGDIRYFAMHRLKPRMAQPGDRLVHLTRKVGSLYHAGTIAGPMVSGVGKTSLSIGAQYESNRGAPEPIISKSQLNALRNATTGSDATCSISDFDPLEIARQLTVMASKVFCDIQPHELLSLDWNNKNSTKALNVRRMCILNTDLAHVVGHTILAPDDTKKRALLIKHWSKVAKWCLEMSNYESLMAIMCSINSSVVQRLKRTWEMISKKTRARLEELNGIVDFSRNHASLRKRLETPVNACLPFLGVYLTDLTFVNVGNPSFRELPGTMTESGERISVINFDKHRRMARIIGDIQKFQVPYSLRAVPEMQAWMQMQLEQMREGHAQMVSTFHRRSMVIEPKRDPLKLSKMPEGRRMTEPNVDIEDRPRTAQSSKASTIKPHSQTFEFFLKTNIAFKTRADAPPTSDSD